MIKNGMSYSKVGYQRYICKDCKKSTQFRKYPGAKFRDWIIDRVLDLLGQGLTELEVAIRTNKSPSTVHYWKSKYLKVSD